MRPDEHKKKNSARYKRQHAEKAGKKENSKLTKDGKVISKEDTREAFKPVHQEEKKYTRRVVGSNWGKYEEVAEAEERIGVDYNQLLASAGGASSHMVLESERNWEANQDLDSILSIDVHKLASSLCKLSFCERHNFDKSQFDPSLLALLGYQQNNQADAQDDLSAGFSFEDYNFDFFKPKTEKEKETILEEDIGHVAEYQSETTNSEQDSTTECTKDKQIDVIPETGILQDKQSSRMPKDIPFTKEIEPQNTESHQSIAQKNKPTNVKSHEANDDLESELDNLLSGCAEVQITDKKPQSSKNLPAASLKTMTNKPNQEPGKEHDELEDWLDSII